MNNDKVQSLFHERIAEINKSFGQWETIKKFTLLPQEWTVESGELTPTMKIKRKVVNERYLHLIESMYA